MRISNRTAKRMRFHCAWVAGVFMLLDAVSSVWTLFDWLPIQPMIYAGLGLFFAIASGIGHLYRN